MTRISRRTYADMYGPTTGDRVRLADTELWITVEHDHTIYGEEVKFGGGKVIRDGMGQSQRSQAQGAVDTVITNALIVDTWGIVKADVAIKNGRIHAIGKAGNPDVQPGVTIIIGPGTEIISGEGKILTAGGVDSHIHFICPQQVEEAPARIISSSAWGWEALPLPERAMLTGRPSAAWSMRIMCHGPGVQVVAEVPVAGPVPPPHIVVMPEASASSTCCGQMKWMWLSTPPAVSILPSPAMISVPGPMMIVTPGWMSGLPALPIAEIMPFLMPTSALTMPQ